MPEVFKSTAQALASAIASAPVIPLAAIPTVDRERYEAEQERAYRRIQQMWTTTEHCMMFEARAATGLGQILSLHQHGIDSLVMWEHQNLGQGFRPEMHLGCVERIELVKLALRTSKVLALAFARGDKTAIDALARSPRAFIEQALRQVLGR
jgi:hypothetical protein